MMAHLVSEPRLPSYYLIPAHNTEVMTLFYIMEKNTA